MAAVTSCHWCRRPYALEFQLPEPSRNQCSCRSLVTTLPVGVALVSLSCTSGVVRGPRYLIREGTKGRSPNKVFPSTSHEVLAEVATVLPVLLGNEANFLVTDALGHADRSFVALKGPGQDQAQAEDVEDVLRAHSCLICAVAFVPVRLLADQGASGDDPVPVINPVKAGVADVNAI